MRRRVVCPRSHPASLHARGLSGPFGKGSQCFKNPRAALCSGSFAAFATGSQCFTGGHPPDPQWAAPSSRQSGIYGLELRHGAGGAVAHPPKLCTCRVSPRSPLRPAAPCAWSYRGGRGRPGRGQTVSCGQAGFALARPPAPRLPRPAGPPRRAGLPGRGQTVSRGQAGFALARTHRARAAAAWQASATW